jgi:uncharacterized protein (DUF1778 family)
MPEAKSARINLRLSPGALETVRAAASVQQQDLTSFILGAAMERARAVLAEDRILRLTSQEVNQLERALADEPEVVPQLKAFSRRFSADWESVSGRGPCRPSVPLEDRRTDTPEHRRLGGVTCGNAVS